MVLSATIEDIDKDKAQAIVEHLKQMSSNSTLTLLEVKSGSVLLILESSEEEFNKIKLSFESGNLSKILNVEVLDILQNYNYKEKSSISVSAFERFLEWLTKDSKEDSGIAFEKLRSRLVRYYNWTTQYNAEDLADETITRVIAKIEKNEVDYQFSNPWHLLIQTSKFVRLEFLKRSVSVELLEMASPQYSKVDKGEDDADKRLECLHKCLQNISEEDREIVLNYYSDDSNIKLKEKRAKLASSLGRSLPQLKIKVLRLRDKLARCIENCVNEERE